MKKVFILCLIVCFIFPIVASGSSPSNQISTLVEYSNLIIIARVIENKDDNVKLKIEDIIYGKEKVKSLMLLFGL